MLNDSQIAHVARALDTAERERRQIRPISLDFPAMDVADAYAIQDAWMAMKLATGRAVRGRKIGLTSRVMQEAMHIDEPDYGTLLDDMFFADGDGIEAAQFTDPRVEVELAFILKRRITGPVTLFAVLDATDYVMPAIEIIARAQLSDRPGYRAPRASCSDNHCPTNAASAGVVLWESAHQARRLRSALGGARCCNKKRA